MHYQSTIFSQLMKALPRQRFERIAKAHHTGRAKRSLNEWQHVTAMVFAQASGARSLRDLERVTERQSGLMSHIGLSGLKRSTLSDANANRPAGLFEAVAQELAGKLANGGIGKEALRLIDATHFVAGRKIAQWSGAGGIKLHLMYAPDDARPVCFAVTPQNVNDITAAKTMPIAQNTTYVFDKGYYNFEFWAKIDAAGSRFVTRLKINSPAQLIAEHAVAEATNILRDATVRLNPRLSSTRKNPMAKPLRLIEVKISGGRIITLISNDLASSAQIIADLYKQRWQIELFFKWIKQNLKLAHFLGNSRNAVIIQIMTALITYMLMRITALKLKTNLGLQASARLFQAMLLMRRDISDIFKPPPRYKSKPQNQLNLWPQNA